MQFGTNHLGHFAFTGLLLDRVLAGAGFAGRDGQQRRPSHRPPASTSTTCSGSAATAGSAPTGSPSWPTCCSPTNCSGGCTAPDTIAVAAHPGGSRHRVDAQPAAAGRASRCRVRAAVPGPPTWARCRRCAPQPIPACSAGSTYGPDGFGEQRGYPKVVASSTASHDTDAQRRLWAVSEELTSVVSPVG